MIKGFVVVVIVFAVIGRLVYFFLLGQPCCFWCYCLLVRDKDFFLVLFVTVWDCLVLVAFFCLWISCVASCSVCFL